MPSASNCGESFPAGSRAADPGVHPCLCRCHGNRDAVNGVAGAEGSCGVPAAPAMAQASSQTPLLHRAEVGQGRGWGGGCPGSPGSSRGQWGATSPSCRLNPWPHQTRFFGFRFWRRGTPAQGCWRGRAGRGSPGGLNPLCWGAAGEGEPWRGVSWGGTGAGCPSDTLSCPPRVPAAAGRQTAGTCSAGRGSGPRHCSSAWSRSCAWPARSRQW